MYSMYEVRSKSFEPDYEKYFICKNGLQVQIQHLVKPIKYNIKLELPICVSEIDCSQSEYFQYIFAKNVTFRILSLFNRK